VVSSCHYTPLHCGKLIAMNVIELKRFCGVGRSTVPGDASAGRLIVTLYSHTLNDVGKNYLSSRIYYHQNIQDIFY